MSNDPIFIQYIMGNTVNGTCYTGIRARTTGAPQNHWFGPSGDPRATGIGTPVYWYNVYINNFRKQFFTLGLVIEK